MENKNRVIFFVESYFNKRDYDRFGMETLINNGFDVEVWDFTPALSLGAYRNVMPPDPIEWSGYRLFKTKKEVIAAILSLWKTCVVVSLVSYSFDSLPIYRALSKKKIFYCAQGFALPISGLSPSRRLRKRITSFTMKRLFLRIFYMIPFRMLGVRPANLNLANAEKFLLVGAPVNATSKILWLHNFDYDLFLKGKSVVSSLRYKARAIFLDQYLPFHPDGIRLGMKLVLDSEEYYKTLCRFFDHLEKKFGEKVVIAAHPRSHYEKMPGIFGERQIVRGKTMELVKEAEVVIAHNSIAINYAVLFKRPLVFITSNKITDSYNKGLFEEPSIAWLASFFVKTAHNIDYPPAVDLAKELVINEAAYAKYKNYYIKKDGSEELPYWQIFANYIKFNRPCEGL